MEEFYFIGLIETREEGEDIRGRRIKHYRWKCQGASLGVILRVGVRTR